MAERDWIASENHVGFSMMTRHPAEAPRIVVADRVHEQLWDMLVDQQLKPGERVVVDRVAADLGVSLTPVREALTRLEAEGLVVRRAMSGWRAAPLLDFQRFGELFEMRLLLEPEAARRAVTHATPAQRSQLADIVNQMSAYSGGEYFEQFRTLINLDQQFHLSLAEASGNGLLFDAITRLHAHPHLYRLYRKIGIVTNTSREHARILETVQQGDPENAAEAMSNHIRVSHRRLAPWLATARTRRQP
jgi:DNA-binding GntR family transcriptional regulator